MSAVAPKTVPYYGGKNETSKHSKVGKWIAAHLPMREVYAEPFAGMLGVLLQRKRALSEIANDADGRITNWWRCVRDAPDEFAQMIAATPRSDWNFERAQRTLDGLEVPDMSDPDGAHDLEIGVATHIVIADSLMHGLGRAGAMAVSYAHRGGRATTQVHLLANRLRKVQLLNRDAAVVLKRLAPHDNCVVYCDPPYEGSADTTIYGSGIADKGEMAALLRGQRGYVAVSGYDDDWDCLGWNSVEMPAHFTGAGSAGGSITRRVEKVWLNADLPTGLF